MFIIATCQRYSHQSCCKNLQEVRELRVMLLMLVLDVDLGRMSFMKNCGGKLMRVPITM